jgi:aminoglycoside phosphotransferase family enzyme
MVQTVPQAAPLIAEVLKFVASQFRAGRQMEGVIDEFADQMAQFASQPKPPDPKQVKEQADAEAAKLKQQTDAQTAQADAAERAANAQKTASEAQAGPRAAQARSRRAGPAA